MAPPMTTMTTWRRRPGFSSGLLAEVKAASTRMRLTMSTQLRNRARRVAGTGSLPIRSSAAAASGTDG